MIVGSCATSLTKPFNSMRIPLTYAFALCILFAATSCRNDLQEVNEVIKKDRFPLLTTQNVNMLYSDSARLKIRLKSPVVEDYGGIYPKTIFPKGVFIEFYDDSARVNSSLKSDYAERRDKEQLMVAKKDVVVVNIKGEQLNTEKLIWDGKRRKIYTDTFVKITTADQVIMGNGFESDETFTEYEIKDITGTIMLGE